MICVLYPETQYGWFRWPRAASLGRKRKRKSQPGKYALRADTLRHLCGVLCRIHVLECLSARPDGFHSVVRIEPGDLVRVRIDRRRAGPRADLCVSVP